MIKAKSELQKEKLAFNLAEGARALGVSKPTLLRMLKDGTIKYSRYGRRIFISRKTLEDFLNN